MNNTIYINKLKKVIKMKVFKTEEEKEEIRRKKLEEQWKRSAAYHVGATEKDDRDIMKEIMNIEMDLSYDYAEKKSLTDLDVIDKFFPKLSAKEKLKIFYYGHYIHERIYFTNKQKMFR